MDEQTLAAWGARQASVRAMLLTSTRAIPGARLDRFSDWDVILVVEEIETWLEDRSWIEDFGEVLIAYWDPVAPDEATGIPVSGNIVEYTGLAKIDFTLWPTEMIPALLSVADLPPELDAGYRVLLDKDEVLRRLPEPTGRGYGLDRPSPDLYLKLVNDFFIGVPYVAKMLARREVLPAKWCLDYDMRYGYLLPMLEWRVAIERDWALAPGVNGKRLQEWLPPNLWAALEGTYAGLGVDENWGALFAMIGLFRQVATEVGESLGVPYPADLDRRVTDRALQVRRGEI